MRSFLVAAILAAGLGLPGCQTKTNPAGGPPATPARLAEIRESYARQKPGTIVGQVTAVLREQNLLAVGDVPADRFARGDVVSILDGNEVTLAVGRVVRVDDKMQDPVHVKYESRADARPPMEGDVVIRLPR